MTEPSFVRWGKVPLLFLYVHKNYVNTTVNEIATSPYSIVFHLSDYVLGQKV